MPGTEVKVTSLRFCDIHKFEMNRPDVVAHYDGRTKQGPWAHMCNTCFASQGVGLGTGKGQRLIYPDGLVSKDA